MVVKVDPPLPCTNVIEGENSCGQPARAAWAELIRTGEDVGRWILTPICEDCAKMDISLYANERIAEFYAEVADE
jgi:hypothetical protein